MLEDVVLSRLANAFAGCTKTMLALGCTVMLLACQTNQELKKDPQQSVKVRTQLAAEYIRKGDLDAAKRSLDLALEIDSKDPTANMMMGVLLQQEGSDINLPKSRCLFQTRH